MERVEGTVGDFPSRSSGQRDTKLGEVTEPTKNLASIGAQDIMPKQAVENFQAYVEPPIKGNPLQSLGSALDRSNNLQVSTGGETLVASQAKVEKKSRSTKASSRRKKDASQKIQDALSSRPANTRSKEAMGSSEAPTRVQKQNLSVRTQSLSSPNKSLSIVGLAAQQDQLSISIPRQPSTPSRKGDPPTDEPTVPHSGEATRSSRATVSSAVGPSHNTRSKSIDKGPTGLDGTHSTKQRSKVTSRPPLSPLVPVSPPKAPSVISPLSAASAQSANAAFLSTPSLTTPVETRAARDDDEIVSTIWSDPSSSRSSMNEAERGAVLELADRLRQRASSMQRKRTGRKSRMNIVKEEGEDTSSK